MRILVVSQYPISPAIHGGQKRTAAIVSFYKKKHEVCHVGLYWPNAYKNESETQHLRHVLVSDKRLIAQLQLHPERSDLLLGRSLSIKSHAAREFRDIITSFNPHIVHIEQPYLVAPLKAILEEVACKSVIVHGSQNIESSLKKGIYTHILPPKDLTYLIKNTKSVEDEAIDQADVNIGVSQADIKALRRNNKSPWLIAGNGTDHIDTSPGQPKKVKRRSGIVFIGSAHPPNYIGLESLLSDTRFLGDENSLLLIGGIADYFRHKYSPDDPFWVGKVAIGQVDEKDLQKYIKQAAIIILPITTGGGSNLKTAEAIGARKKIVSTSFAFRGYERYETLPNIFIANTADEFKKMLLRALTATYQPYTDSQLRLLRRLSWKYTLRLLAIVPYYAQALLLVSRLKGAVKSK